MGLIVLIGIIVVVGLLSPWTTKDSPDADKEAPPETPAIQEPYGIWPETAVPKVAASEDMQSVEIGTKFTSSRGGSITAVRFYKATDNSGIHIGKLWDSSGKLLSQTSFQGETSNGWQTSAFAQPVPIRSGVEYTVSYNAPNGRYAGDSAIFSDGKTIKRNDLTGLAGVYTYGSGVPNQTWGDSAYYVDVLFAPQGAAEAENTPNPPPSTATDWPDASNTGVPNATKLTPYNGPCTITEANTVIDSKVVNCVLSIRTSGVIITRSKINGAINTDENSTGYSFTIADSAVDVGQRPGTAIGAVHFKALRVHVTGGNRSFNCWKDCVIQDSYMHGQFKDVSGAAHESGIRMGSGATIQHNTIVCNAPNIPPDAGCSAGLTGYGDFGPVQNNTIDRNLFKATTGGFCAYGGSSVGKTYPLTSGIVFTRNVFERGQTGKCGTWGAITSFDPSRPGNIWSENTWSDGTTAQSAN